MSTRTIAFSVLFALAVGCSDEAIPVPDDESGNPYQPPGSQREPLVPGYSFAPPAIPLERTGTPFKPPAPIWPNASIVDVALPDANAFQLGLDGSVPVAGLPVRIEVRRESTRPAG